MTVVVNTPGDFTLANYRRAAYGREPVQIGRGARRVMDESRSRFAGLLRAGPPAEPARRRHAGDSGEAAASPGIAQLVGRHEDDRIVGGFGVPRLDTPVFRGIVFARLVDLVSGYALARPVVAERVAALLERPSAEAGLGGQPGAGERHLLRRLLDDVDRSDFDDAEERALFGGSPCSAALVADAALRARHRLEQAEAVFALSIEAFSAPLGAYDAALDDLFGDLHEAAALRSLRAHLAGVDVEGRRFHQAPVSYRIIPRVLGSAGRAVSAVEKAATGSLASVTVEEIWLPAGRLNRDPRPVASGASHNATAYPALNALSAAWADLAFVGERQVTALNTAETSGLPVNLAVPDVPRSGTYAYGWAASGYVEEARAAAAPALLPAVGSGPVDDVEPPTFTSHRRERRAAECLDGVLTILALVSSQALFVTSREPPDGLRPLLDAVRSVFPPIVAVTGRDLSLEAGRLQRAFGEAAVTGLLGAGSTLDDGNKELTR